METVRSHIESARALFPKKGVKLAAKKALPLKKSLLAIVSDFIDTDDLTHIVFKGHWYRMTPSQRSQALALMSRLVKTNYAIALYRERASPLLFVREDLQDTTREVTIEIKFLHEDGPYFFRRRFRLHLVSNSWKCFDYSNRNMELSAGYISQVNKMVAKGGFERLFKKMEKTAQNTESRLLTLLQAAAK
jgi:ABC-type transporter MlaC component